MSQLYYILFVLSNYIPNSQRSRQGVKVLFESGCPSKCIWIKRQSSTRGARCPKPWVADQPRQPSRWELRDKVSLQMTSALRGGARSFLRTLPIWSYISTDFGIEFEQSSYWVRVEEKEAPLASCCVVSSSMTEWTASAATVIGCLGRSRVFPRFTYTPPLLFLYFPCLLGR